MRPLPHPATAAHARAAVSPVSVPLGSPPVPHSRRASSAAATSSDNSSGRSSPPARRRRPPSKKQAPPPPPPPPPVAVVDVDDPFTAVWDGVIVGDGMDIARAADPALWAHEAHLRYRYERYRSTLVALETEHGSLEAAAAGYTRFGLTPDPAGPPGAVRYREWAPGAVGATLVGDFDDWGAGIELTPDPVAPGVWTASLHASTIPHGSRLRLRLRHPGGWTTDAVPAWTRRAVPEVGGNMGARFEGVHWDPPVEERHAWTHSRPPWPRPHPATGAPTAPRIYEAHVGMAGEAPTVSTYDHFRESVLPRIAGAGYTHVQLMGVAEHSYYGSFGYQVTSPFAVSSRCGTPEAFKALVDAAHGHGLGVLVDLVHAHVSSNAADGLAGYDFSGVEVGGGGGGNTTAPPPPDAGGTAPPPPDASAYCVPGPSGTHPAWGSRLLAYDRPRVLEYLLSNVRFWVEEYRVDGFRFDGVTSMLYRHHGVGLGFSGDYREYFSPAADVEATVYLMLANELCGRLGAAQGRAGPLLTVAEDVSGMPALCRPVAEGGVGFGARLAMGIPDLWARLARESAPVNGAATTAEDLAAVDARVWNPSTIVSALTNRRYSEATIAYVECHDQSMVGDAPLAWRLMGEAMYDGMSALTPPSPVIDRGLALHKIARLATLALGGDGWLAFMGDEWGHPEWVDFPREGNAWSHARARRAWSLADAPHLRYAHLRAWDAACMALEDTHGFLGAAHQVVSFVGKGGGGSDASSADPAAHVVVAERGPLVFVFNFSPTVDLAGFKVGVGLGGTYTVALDSDDRAYGGRGRVGHGVDHFTTPATEEEEGEGGFHGRPHWMQVCAPARSAVAYVRVE